MRRLYKQTQQQSGNWQSRSFSSLSVLPFAFSDHSSRGNALQRQLQTDLMQYNTTKPPRSRKSPDKATMLDHTQSTGVLSIRKLPGVKTCMAILVASTNIRDEEGVNRYYPMGYFLQFGYWRLRIVVRDSLYCILYMYIYMYRYNTVLVNKVGGFHMADRGTELRTLFPPSNMLNKFKFLLYFFCLPKFPSCSHSVSILTRVIHVLCTHSLRA